MNKTEYIGKLNALYVGEKNCLEELITAYDEKDKEIERLNNIINELEKYIKESCWKDDWGVESIYVKMLLNKLQELKGSNGAIPPEAIGTNGENGGLFDYGDR